MLKNFLANLYLIFVSKKKDVEMFLAFPQWNYLMADQIIAILKIIDEEVAGSFAFGLRISRKHLIKEKATVLSTLNIMGNLHLFPRRFEFEEAWKFFTKLLHEGMEEENEFYFRKSKEGQVRNRYNCHLEAVATSILRSIYDKDSKRIPLI